MVFLLTKSLSLTESLFFPAPLRDDLSLLLPRRRVLFLSPLSLSGVTRIGDLIAAVFSLSSSSVPSSLSLDMSSGDTRNHKE